MNLKNRLDAVLLMAEGKGTLLDVGCDHAYLAIEAIKRKAADKVIASDVNKGPLLKAEENVKRAGLSEKIELRLGSGIEVIDEYEADTVVMAGMGGILISEILEKNPTLSKTVKKYILQPMNSKEDLRRYLVCSGYSVDYETICKEKGKIYSIFSVTPKKSKPYEKEIFYYTGDLLNLKNTDKELVFEYLLKTENKFLKIKENLALAKEKDESQAEYVEKILEEILWLKSEISKN